MAAVTTCCNLMIPKKGEIITVRCYSGEVINIVLSKLLDVGVIDPKPQIRKTVHLNLDPSFDPFLSQSESVQKLFISFNDEEFEIKEQALMTLGRLSPRNPAIILPFLRRILQQLLFTLQYSDDALEKERSARLLGHIVTRSLNSLVRTPPKFYLRFFQQSIIRILGYRHLVFALSENYPN